MKPHLEVNTLVGGFNLEEDQGQFFNLIAKGQLDLKRDTVRYKGKVGVYKLTPSLIKPIIDGL